MSALKKALPAAVMGVGLLAAGATWLGRKATGHHGGSAALAVLLLSIPIGLIVATTLPRWLTNRVGRGLGVTVTDAGALERWQQIRTLVIDPFHSLTTGHLVVTDVEPVDPDHDRNLRWFAGALAHSYDDPVGRAVAKLAGQGRLTNVAQEPGLGIRGSVDRHPVRVGQPQWIGLAENPSPLIGTTVAVDVDQRPLGRITVADEVRPDAARQLDRLRRTGLTPALASPRSAAETERLADLSSSPAWHAETDPLQFARELAVGDGLVGLVRSDPAGTASLLAIDTSGTTPDDSIRLTTPAIDTVVDAVTLAIRSHRARRRAVRVALALWLLPLPFAAVGLVAPVPALAVAVATWAVVALACSWDFAGIKEKAEPADD